MTNIQNVIVFLWFVPVVGFIVLPLTWSLCGVLYRIFERSMLQDIRGFVALNNRDAEGGRETEQRDRPRIHLEKGVACIDEKCKCCKATVSNISKQGICLSDVHRKMDLETNPFRVIFRTRQQDYTLLAKPIWKRMAEKGWVVGAEIDRIPTEWKNLVSGLSQSLTAEPV